MKKTYIGSSELVKTHWNLMGRLSWAERRPEIWPEKDLPDFSSASRSRSRIFLVLKKSRQTFVMSWQKPLRCLVRWFMCSCSFSFIASGTVWACSRSWAPGKLFQFFDKVILCWWSEISWLWDSAEAAVTGEQAGSCVQSWTRSWVTLLLVAACDWIGLGISILWAPSLFIAMMWISPNFQFWC